MKLQKLMISILMLITAALGIAATFSNDLLVLGMCVFIYLCLMAVLWYVEWLEQKARNRAYGRWQ